MEDLFSTRIAVNNEKVNYHVRFDHGRYVFISEAENPAFPSFSFKREHDEWLEQEQVPVDVKDQAVDALDNYLLKQH